MFSRQTTVFEVDSAMLEQADPAALVALLAGFAEDPATAKRHRSSVALSFAAAGVADPKRDLRALSYLTELWAACPAVGYFLDGDPPFYRLREISLALACARLKDAGGMELLMLFQDTHARLLVMARLFAEQIGDDEHTLDDVFLVNRVPAAMDETARLRALAILLPVLEAPGDGPGDSLALGLDEAAMLWGRERSAFPTVEAYVQAIAAAVRSPG